MIPMIRRILPSVIAADIIGVQPMQGAAGAVFTMTREKKLSTLRFSKIKVDMHWNIWFDSGVSFNSMREIEEWLKTYPNSDYWFYQGRLPGDFYVNIYDEEMLTAFTLRWQNSPAA